MKIFRDVGALLFVALLLLGCGGRPNQSSEAANAQEPEPLGSTTVNDLVIDDAAGNLALPSDTGALYLTISNTGSRADTLIGAVTAGCEVVEIHQSLMKDGVMLMQPVEGGQLSVPAGEIVRFEPGGTHLMCIGKEKFEIGDTVSLTLKFAMAGPVDIQVPIVDPAAP